MEQRSDDGQFLSHAVGVGGHQIPQYGIDSKVLRLSSDALLPRLCGHPIDVRQEIQVLNACQVLIDVRIVRNIGRHLFTGHRLGAHVFAVHQNLPLVEVVDSHHRLYGSGLPGPVVPDETVDVARPHCERQIRHRGLAAFVSLCQVFDFQHFPSLRLF